MMPGLFTTIPREVTYSFKLGMTAAHLGTYALQVAFNGINNVAVNTLETDGVFGPNTDVRVKAYQQLNGLIADGVAGPVTQRALARAMSKLADPDARIPTGIIDGLIDGESGGYIDAKNWTVPGGVDL